MKGETRPEAHVAAVKSDMMRHGKFWVFQSLEVRGFMVLGGGGGRGRMRFGGEGLSPMAAARPLRSNSRVMVCSILVKQISMP